MINAGNGRWRGGILAAGFMLLPVVAMSLAGCERKSEAAAPAVPSPVRAVTVQLQPATEDARYPAVIRPRIEANVGFRTSGKVIERLVNVGARVEEGAPLARLDPTDLELAVRAAKAQLEATRAEALNARRELERSERLRQGDWTSRQSYDTRRTAMEKAEAAVRQIEADLAVKTNALEYTTLLADGPGIITATQVEPGQVVTAGQTAFTVARLGELEAQANIPENRVGALSRQTLSVELWSMPGQAIEGSLRELSPAADSATRTFQARISLKEPPAGVQIGMTATVTARSNVPGTIARLPLASLTQNGTDPAVWVISESGGTIELRPVRVVAYAGNELIVGDGLRSGEKVVSAGVHKLVAGQPVRVWAEPAR